jgi:hypothetical protein
MLGGEACKRKMYDLPANGINQIYCGVRGACDGDRSHPRKFALPQQLPCRHPFALHRPFLIGRINQPQLLHVLRPTRKSAQ